MSKIFLAAGVGIGAGVAIVGVVRLAMWSIRYAEESSKLRRLENAHRWRPNRKSLHLAPSA